MTRQSIGRAKRRLPSLTAASVVWCGRPVNTWTAGAPPRCRHTSPHYPGLNCTPATIPLGLLATPEDEKGGVERGREKTREGGGERQVSRRCWRRRRRRKNSPDRKKKKNRRTLMTCACACSTATHRQAPPVLHHHTEYFTAAQREEAANEGSWSYSHYSAGWACRAVTCVT